MMVCPIPCLVGGDDLKFLEGRWRRVFPQKIGVNCPGRGVTNSWPLYLSVNSGVWQHYDP